MNREKLLTSFITGTLMVAAHNVMPLLLVPGAVSVCGSLLAYGLESYGEYQNMFSTLGIKNKNGVFPKLLGKRLIGKNVARVYTIPPGMEFKDIEQHKEKMENILHSSISLTRENYTFIITKLKNRYPKILKKDFRECSKGCVFDIGEDMAGNIVKLNLSGTEMHTGVFGSTGTGKSVFLNIIMIQIILNDFEVRVVDLKGGVEFGMYRDYPKLTKFATKIDDAKAILESTLALMEKRYEKLTEARCKSFKDYKGKDMAPVYLIIDEYNALVGDKDAKKTLFELLSRARAANIIVFICTQRPSADVLPGNIKCNLKNIISFQVETNTDSEVVTSQKGNYIAAKDLHAPGEGFIKTCGKFKLFKSYYLTDEEIHSQIADKLTGAPRRIENINNRRSVPNKSKNDINAIKELI